MYETGVQTGPALGEMEAPRGPMVQEMQVPYFPMGELAGSELAHRTDVRY